MARPAARRGGDDLPRGAVPRMSTPSTICSGITVRKALRPRPQNPVAPRPTKKRPFPTRGFLLTLGQHGEDTRVVSGKVQRRPTRPHDMTGMDDGRQKRFLPLRLDQIRLDLRLPDSNFAEGMPRLHFGSGTSTLGPCTQILPVCRKCRTCQRRASTRCLALASLKQIMSMAMSGRKDCSCAEANTTGTAREFALTPPCVGDFVNARFISKRKNRGS